MTRIPVSFQVGNEARRNQELLLFESAGTAKSGKSASRTNKSLITAPAKSGIAVSLGTTRLHSEASHRLQKEKPLRPESGPGDTPLLLWKGDQANFDLYVPYVYSLASCKYNTPDREWKTTIHCHITVMKVSVTSFRGIGWRSRNSEEVLLHDVTTASWRVGS
jgi:hypothetical protein